MLSGMLSRPGWTAYSLMMLALRPHAFFARLSGLGWYGDALRSWSGGFGLGERGSVLEVGCSTGALARYLASNGQRVVGLDRSARAIRHARTKSAAREESAGHAPGPIFMVGNAHCLPFTNGHFKASVGASLLNVVPEPERVVAEMARVTATGGVVSYLFPVPQMDSISARRFVERNALTGFSAQAISLWAALARKLDPAEGKWLLASAGLADITCVRYLDGMVCGITGRRIENQTRRAPRGTRECGPATDA